MKRRDLESRVAALGWQLARHGGSHDVWTKTDKAHVLAIPRHAEINEHTARGILRDAAR